MIESFKNKALRDLWMTGKSSGVSPSLHKRAIRKLDALNAATQVLDLNQPGFDFHALHGIPARWSIHVNGPWCITFEWDGTAALRVDLEQYH